MGFSIFLVMLLLGANALLLVAIETRIDAMSVASAALLASATQLKTVAQALADNLPNEDSAATTADVNATAVVVADALAILAPLAPAPQA